MVSTTSFNSYSTSSLVSGDVITVTMSSTATCVTSTSVISNSITMTGSGSAVPSVVISGPTTICSGTFTTFTAVATNGGSFPNYQWRRNGFTVSSGSSNTYSTNFLFSGDIITCVLTSNLACATSSTATSNALSLTVLSLVTSTPPSVVISTTSTVAVPGSIVTFTATPTNGGTLPSYQWMRNGFNVGINSSTYTFNNFFPGDIITCTVTSSIACVTPSTATSNIITMTAVSATYAVSGRIVTTQSQPIPGVTVGVNTTSRDSVITTVTGAYSFGIPSTGTFVVTPKKNNDIVKASGVNVLDVILTQYHILGRVLLNTPYKIIAADVNGDGNINIFDVLFSKRLILGVDTTFAGNRLWAFVDSSYVFSDPTIPFPYNSTRSYTSLTSSLANQSFIGVKLGDVNQDIVPSVGVSSVSGMKTPVQLYYDTASSDQFGNVRLKIRTKNFRELLGLQFTLGFNNSVLDYGGVENGSIAMEYGNVNLKDGALTFIWNDAANVSKTFADGTILFELILKKKGLMQHEDISIDSRFTPAVAYDKELAAHPVVKGYGIILGDQPVFVTENMQLSPNPSRGPVKVKIIAASPKQVTLIVTDALGRVLMEKKVGLVQGPNEINFNLHQNSKLAQGIYYIRANGLDGKMVKELMVIE